jgi:hypothetical protein
MFGTDEETTDKEESGGKGKLFALFLAIAGAAGYFLKKKRERELDEALWEEPRSL